MILVSVGNTNTRIARTEGGRDFQYLDWPSAWPAAKILGSLTETWTQALKQEDIYVGGVVPDAISAWNAALAGASLPTWDPERFHRLVSHAYKPPESLGFDRRCCLLAARDIHTYPDCVVIDAGTAITIDLLQNGRFVGGRILPGLRMQLHCLANETALLPEPEGVSAFQPQELLGNSTCMAIQAGVYHSALAAIHSAVADYRRVAGNMAILLTGGDMQILAPAVPDAILDKHLLLRGFYLLVTVQSCSSW